MGRHDRATGYFDKGAREMNLSKVSQRASQWMGFSNEVFQHIEDYTVPQYVDMPDDQAESFTIQEIQMNLKRYVNRINSNSRGTGEAIRDCYKIAHYACLLLARILKDLKGKENGLS